VVAACAVDVDDLSGAGVPEEGAGAGLDELPAGVGFDPVGSAGERAEVVGPGLGGPAGLVFDGVVEVEAPYARSPMCCTPYSSNRSGSGSPTGHA